MLYFLQASARGVSSPATEGFLPSPGPQSRASRSNWPNKCQQKRTPRSLHQWIHKEQLRPVPSLPRSKVSKWNGSSHICCPNRTWPKVWEGSKPSPPRKESNIVVNWNHPRQDGKRKRLKQVETSLNQCSTQEQCTNDTSNSLDPSTHAQADSLTYVASDQLQVRDAWSNQKCHGGSHSPGQNHVGHGGRDVPKDASMQHVGSKKCHQVPGQKPSKDGFLAHNGGNG